MQTIKYIDGFKSEYSITLNAYEYSLMQYAFTVVLNENRIADTALKNDLQKMFETKPVEFNEQKFAEAMTDAIKKTLIRTANVDATTIDRIFKHEI